MQKKALAYAENILSDIKDFMPKDEYQDAVKDFCQAFISGGDAAIETAREIIKGEEDINSPEEDNTVHKDITMIDKDRNVLKAKIEQREKI